MLTIFPLWYQSLVLGMLGLFLGSFLGCLAWRIVHGESALRGRSHCETCGHVLTVLDLVPVFSWIFLGGKCRYCGTKISIACPLTELICAAGYLSLFWRFGLSVELALSLVLFSLLLAASLTDLEDGWIPDRFAAFGAVVYVCLAFLPGQEGALFDGLIGCFGILLPMLVLVFLAEKKLGQPAMGGGDLKLFALCGLYVGWQQGILLLLLSCIFGIVLAALMGKLRPATPFPFAPAIALSAWATFLWGERVLSWYMGMFF